VSVGKTMLVNFPDDYRREMEAAASSSGIDRDLLIVGNTMFDVKKIGGCSTLIVESQRSTTGGPLFGRNLDFPTLGILEKYGLVVVCRPEGKHAFVSIAFPGMLGCLSGMNDAGLAVATLEVYSSADGAANFSLLGTPYAMCFRRLLEECSTLDEAEKLLKTLRRTTSMNLAVCDRRQGAVLEMTIKSVVRREAHEGLCACTNHFRSPQLATATACPRYDALSQAARLPKLGLRDVSQRLHAANQGENTFQTMVFEPATLTLHLAMGSCPSSALPLKELDLRPLLACE
jgi:isopenicillin-N N-acyltransferase like protein